MYKRRSGLKNVKVAIEASANYSYIVDALAKEGYEILVADLTRGNLFPKIKNKIHGELIKRGIMEKLEEEIKKLSFLHITFYLFKLLYSLSEFFGRVDSFHILPYFSFIKCYSANTSVCHNHLMFKEE